MGMAAVFLYAMGEGVILGALSWVMDGQREDIPLDIVPAQQN